MKKILSIFLFLFLVSFSGAGIIQAEDLYYLPNRNTHYYRSQHAYGFSQEMPDGYVIEPEAYIPAVYTIITDIDDVNEEDVWNFHESYTVPYDKKEESYYLGYCADLFVDIRETEPYYKVDLKDSTFLKDEVKENLLGILYHSYPYISEEDMKNELMEAGILVKKGNFVTGKSNAKPTRNVGLDEFVAATTQAILNYSNPGGVTHRYTQTYELTSRTVTRAAGLWDNTVKEGKNEEVENNINDIFNYLITLKGTESDLTHSLKFTNVSLKDEKTVSFQLESLHLLEEDLDLTIYDQEKPIETLKLKDIPKVEDHYELPLNQPINDLTLGLDGNVKQQGAYVFEAKNNNEYLEDTPATQTLISLSSYPIVVHEKQAIEKIPIEVTKEVDNDFVSYGETVNYLITLKNTGKTPLENVLVTDAVPDALKIVEADGGKVENSQIVWTLNLEPEETKELHVSATVKDNAAQAEVINKVVVTYNGMNAEAEIPITIFDNPKTGAVALYGLLLLGVGGLGCYFFYHRKFYHI